jgi:hypothetical protein
MILPYGSQMLLLLPPPLPPQLPLLPRALLPLLATSIRGMQAA